MRTTNRKIAFLFEEADPAAVEKFGGKGAGLAELARLGVPVPSGFTVSTTVARAFAQHGRLPNRLLTQLKLGVAALERETGKRFGDAEKPLLVSVRSGAAVSMPGMMDTVLNIGLTPAITAEWGKRVGHGFARDCYDRLARMYEQVIGSRVSTDPWEQVETALTAVLKSWDSPRAKAYRSAQGIPETLGTAVTIQAMVFGNRGPTSGTGVVFSRNVATGSPGLWGEFLPEAQGEDVVAGVRTPMPIETMRVWNPKVYSQLDRHVRNLEVHRGDAVDVEFTVEEGRLYILQVRAAKRTPVAAATIAVHFQWEGRCSKKDALSRVSDNEVEALAAPGFDAKALAEAVQNCLKGQGLPASPGATVGRAVFSSNEAVEAAKKGEKVVLVRPDTSPDDLPGMLAAVAIVTKTGGTTSHAAVVARGLNKPAVVGCSNLRVGAGEIISVDGTTGVVVLGSVPLLAQAQKKEVNIFLRWWDQAERGKAVSPRFALETAGESVSVHRLINDFYLVDAMALAATKTAFVRDAVKIKNRVQQSVAERLAAYLAVAVSGELRHARPDWKNCEAAYKVLREKFQIRQGGDRRQAQLATVEVLKKSNLETQAEYLELATTVFISGNWSGSFGGKKWAAIAQAAHGFATGKLSHAVFADHAFDLQHNNGTVFGKNPMLTGDRGLVHCQLEEKKHATSVADLFHRLSKRGDFSPEVKALFEKGQTLGLWETKQKAA